GSAMPLTAVQKARFKASAKPVDICFVLDTTGSMPDMIDGLVMCFDSIEDTLHRLQLDWRMTAVSFGDLRVPGDRIVGDLPFVATAERARRLLRDLPRFYGGADNGGSSLEAVLAGLAKPYRPEAVTVLIVLTHDSPIENAQLTAGSVNQQIYSQEAVCFVASPPRLGYEQWAHDNGGVWYCISFSMDAMGIVRFLSGLVAEAAQVAHWVHELAGGSVKRYRELGSGPIDAFFRHA
ncbi:MAG: VWA domain-containing protein, partial [Actinomycetota bacterium]|nr:VWA domain-containing protein [Actinomycetota bacterium]